MIVRGSSAEPNEFNVGPLVRVTCPRRCAAPLAHEFCHISNIDKELLNIRGPRVEREREREKRERERERVSE